MSAAPISTPTEAPRQELMSALSTLLEAGKYSDLTIVSGSKTYAVHRAIICSRSGFFDGAVSSPFRESQSSIIDLSEDDPTAVEHMVHYFYHLDYLLPPQPRLHTPQSSPAQSLPTSPMSPPGSAFSPLSPCSATAQQSFRRPRKLNLAMVEDPLIATAAANAHNVDSCLPLSPEMPASPSVGTKSNPFTLDSALDDTGSDTNPFELLSDLEVSPTPEPHLMAHARVYALADKYHIAGLKTLAGAKFACQVQTHWAGEEFADSLVEVYENSLETDRGLRDVCLQVFREHREIAERREIQEAVKGTPELAWELLRTTLGLPIC
ncbi:hypothetical protein P152DRAFT_460190 [Eremomyces bilateralis CBS 781.70]|uniref:BTB domain-containing protein n=1 Tax=Eremomyces bilateralis CBS 781.70 TaxID=1392243 RepID=A0A6G1FZB4_9PEZI|nr:uncharacterized protein P152DRAFT_460190 [Eremomyces bilateralis CBS 781.70]KAF1810899.1 hypothetical protein P152DRAFT_460190 [Eremomyces bilateralis CBS 781.70]